MKNFVTLSPKRKGKKAAYELKQGKRYCNDGTPKRGKDGKQLRLTKVGKAYRAGYLDARKDIGSAFKARQRRKKNKK